METNTPDIAAAPLPVTGQLFRHVDGGYYRFLTLAKHSENLAPLMVYGHLWPFEQGSWARPAQEWTGRFSEVDAIELAAALTSDRTTAQEAVTAAKAARRAAKSELGLEI